MTKHTILPLLLILAAGMGIGSIHNAQMRGAIPGVFTPLGFGLIAATLVIFVCAVILFRFYDKSGVITRRLAIIAATIAFVLEALNLVTTVMAEGSISGWLAHEYLGVIVSAVLFVKILIEKRA